MPPETGASGTSAEIRGLEDPDGALDALDLAITRRLREAGEIMGIKVLDHIIIGDEQFTSFVSQGLM